MTTVVVNTYIQDVTQNLTGEYDDLLVTSAGSLVETQGEIGVSSTGDFDSITIDGLVFSAGQEGGRGVAITGNNTTLFVNGQVQGGGDYGVQVTSAGGNYVNVGSQGSIESVSGGVAVDFEGNPSSPFQTSYSLSNAGDISSGYEAVSVQFGGGDLINNSGEISGPSAIVFYSNVATETVENSGTITGGAYTAIISEESSAGVDIANSGLITGGIGSEDSSAGIDIVNSGLITNGTANRVFSFDDDPGTTSHIDNEGTITGSGFAIYSHSDILDINNSGTIHGGLDSTSSVDVENSGHWHDGTGSSGEVFSLNGADNTVNNAHGGVIHGAITLATGGDTFTNAGDIDGAITFTGTALTNSFTNSGTITGDLTLSGSDSTFTNSGSITGNVTQVNGTDTMANHGQIYGNLTLAGGDTLTNDGVIDGDLTCRTGNTVDTSRGEVTGVINAWASDTFDYHGLFGEQTIDSFTGGTGSTHDTIQFAANDFGSFAAVQKAMSQVGSDVLIKLDATDSITLASVTLSSLVSADFKFV